MIFRILLYLLKYLSWIHLFCNQPFQSSIGFKAHQNLYLTLFTQSKLNEYLYESLVLVRSIDPFSLFDFGNFLVGSSAKSIRNFNGKLIYLKQSVEFIYNTQGFLLCFIVLGAVYLLLRLTVLRQSVLFPTKIYLQVKWRQNLHTIKEFYIFPFLMNIF